MSGPRDSRRGLSLTIVSVVALAGCGGGGGGSLPAGPTPTPVPTPMSPVAIELASGLATSTVAAIAAVVGQNAANTIGGGGGAAKRSTSGGAVYRALSVGMGAGSLHSDLQPRAVGACPRGGTINASCSTGSSTTTITATLSSCRVDDPDSSNIITASGGLSVTLALGGLCGSPTLPTNVTLSIRLSNFFGDVSDGSGAVIERFSATLTQTLIPTGQGCAGTNGSGTVDGTLSDQIDASGINVTVTADHFAFTQISSGTPCVQQVIANGTLDVDDHFASRKFSESFDDDRITLIVGDDGVMQATLDGPLSSTCLGDVEFHTLASLQFPPRSDCPSAGRLAVIRDDGTNGRIEFTPDGVAFDFDADGITDETVGACQSAMQCSG